MITALALSLSALAQEAPSDAEIFARLIEEPAQDAAPRTASSPWWIWPMGLLGAVGAAGVVMRTRQTSGGIPGDIHVLSRAGLSRTASLAMIEVTGADGQSRRMLIGVGGGAPRLVADLSGAPTPAATAATVDWFEEPEATPRAAEPEPAAPQPSDKVGQKLSVTTPEEPAEEPLRRTRSRVKAAYGGHRKPAAGLDLVAEVLAERGSEEPPAEPSATWQDPWAKNFEAMLGRRSG